MMILLGDAVAEFLLSCEADGLKPATLRWYAARLSPFVVRFDGLSLDAITIKETREYCIELRSRPTRYSGQKRQRAGGLSLYTLRGHVKALGKFWDWCEAEYNRDPQANPMRRIRLPAKPQQQPKAIALDDLRLLLMACDDSQMGKRDKAILAFLADTGCRAGGLLTLQPGDVDLYARRARVMEKFSRQRVVPFSAYTGHLLIEWMDVRPPNAETVFCSLGTNHNGTPMAMSGLHWMLKRLKARAGVKGRINPHSFRHGFAREYLKNGGDLATLSRLMGHSTVAVTAEFYAVFTPDELSAQHDKFGPMRSLYGIGTQDRPSGDEAGRAVPRAGDRGEGEG